LPVRVSGGDCAAGIFILKYMKIYIASSWKNEHGVTMLTTLLRDQGHDVASWVENNYGESHNHVTKKMDFETWVRSNESDQSFIFDTDGAAQCHVLVYYGPAGKDAAFECGIAYASGVKLVGLYAKGEDFGLMRKAFMWFSSISDLLDYAKDKGVYKTINP
jgi:hypothetical protein